MLLQLTIITQYICRNWNLDGAIIVEGHVIYLPKCLFGGERRVHKGCGSSCGTLVFIYKRWQNLTDGGWWLIPSSAVDTRILGMWRFGKHFWYRWTFEKFGCMGGQISFWKRNCKSKYLLPVSVLSAISFERSRVGLKQLLPSETIGSTLSIGAQGCYHWMNARRLSSI